MSRPKAFYRRLALGGHLDRYVGSLFFASYATAFLLVVGLFLVLDMASNIDDFLEPWEDGSQAPASVILRYYLLNIPFLYLQVAPMVTLVAGMFTVGKLVRYRETVAALAAGISGQRFLLPVFFGAGVVGLGMFALREWASTAIIDKRDALLDVLENKRFDRSYEGIWIRDQAGSIARLGVFHPATGSPPRARVEDLSVNVHTVDGFVRYKAPSATYVNRDGEVGWLLESGERTEVRREEEVSEAVDSLADFEFSPRLALSFQRGRSNPLELSFGETRELARRDPDNVTYQTLLQYHLSFPLANLVLLLVGLPILMRHRRGSGMEGLVVGCVLCIFFLSADFVFRSLGLQGGIHPLLAGWVPLLFFGSLGAVMLDAMRT